GPLAGLLLGRVGGDSRRAAAAAVAAGKHSSIHELLLQFSPTVCRTLDGASDKSPLRSGHGPGPGINSCWSVESGGVFAHPSSVETLAGERPVTRPVAWKFKETDSLPAARHFAVSRDFSRRPAGSNEQVTKPLLYRLS